MAIDIPFEWGNASEVLAAVGTVGALAAAIVLLEIERRARRRDELERRRSQARLVSCWVLNWSSGPGGADEDGNPFPSDGATLEFRNASSEPVYGVAIRPLDDSGDLQPAEIWRDCLRPGQQERTWVACEVDPESSVGPAFEMSFTDADGRDWKRIGSGVLVPDDRPDSTC